MAVFIQKKIKCTNPKCQASKNNSVSLSIPISMNNQNGNRFRDQIVSQQHNRFVFSCCNKNAYLASSFLYKLDDDKHYWVAYPEADIEKKYDLEKLRDRKHYRKLRELQNKLSSLADDTPQLKALDKIVRPDTTFNNVIVLDGTEEISERFVAEDSNMSSTDLLALKLLVSTNSACRNKKAMPLLCDFRLANSPDLDAQNPLYISTGVENVAQISAVNLRKLKNVVKAHVVDLGIDEAIIQRFSTRANLSLIQASDAANSRYSDDNVRMTATDNLDADKAVANELCNKLQIFKISNKQSDFETFSEAVEKKFGFIFSNQTVSSENLDVFCEILQLIVVLPKIMRGLVDFVTVDPSSLTFNQGAVNVYGEQTICAFNQGNIAKFERLVIHEYAHSVMETSRHRDRIYRGLKEKLGWRVFDLYADDDYEHWIKLLYADLSASEKSSNEFYAAEREVSSRAIVLLTLGLGGTFCKYGQKGDINCLSKADTLKRSKLEDWITTVVDSWPDNLRVLIEYINLNRPAVIDRLINNYGAVYPPAKLCTLSYAHPNSNDEFSAVKMNNGIPQSKLIPLPTLRSNAVCTSSMSHGYKHPKAWFSTLSRSQNNRYIFNYFYKKAYVVDTRKVVNIRLSDPFANNARKEYFAELSADYVRHYLWHRDDGKHSPKVFIRSDIRVWLNSIYSPNLS